MLVRVCQKSIPDFRKPGYGYKTKPQLSQEFRRQASDDSLVRHVLHVLGKSGLIAVICVFLFQEAVWAGPVVNEVLANEPGSTAGLEWVELYNGGSPVSPGDYQLRIKDNLIDLPVDFELESGGYFIVCRRLYATATSPGFESVWGDSSGVWGDTPREDSLPTPFEAAMSLTNDSGCVELIGGTTAVSSLTWARGGLDGYSWERVLPDGDSVAQSVDPCGSTPGFLNSVTSAEYDLALSNVTVRSEDLSTYLVFEIVNSGRNPIDGAGVYLIDMTYAPVDTVDIIAVETSMPGDTIEVEREYVFDGMYFPMMAILSDDDRNRNNMLEFMSVGMQYPPVILTETLANPQGHLGAEWLELKNCTGEAFDLSGWLIGDALNLHEISPDTISIASGERVVLAQSEAEFALYYSDFDGRCIEPGSWASLNNDGDIVRLVDLQGIEADRFEYVAAYDDNHTWCRSEDASEPDRWGRSVSPGGSPGLINDVVFEQSASSLTVSIDPPYVSPDGDGVVDFTTFTIDAPQADDYTVKIYDRQGRVVRTFQQSDQFLLPRLQWDGLSDAGKHLPIGLYILYVEASGVESTKRPIVVAR